MATAPTVREAPPVAESRILLRGVGWELYEAIDASRGDASIPRLTYLDGDLELMSPSYRHELLAELLGDLVKFLALALDLPLRPARSTTFKRRSSDKGKEPDASFYLANEAHVRGLQEIDLETCPPPDLAIEVIVTSPLLDALRVYAGLGVPEVWTLEGEDLRFFHLQPDGTYARRPWSRNFPSLRPGEALEWVLKGDALSYGDWHRQVMAWPRDELARREGPGPGA